MSEIKRPLLRYFGGKWQMRKWIHSYLPEHHVYAEPFAGGASILLSKNRAPGGEILNDLNREIINLFQVMQNAAARLDLKKRLKWTLYCEEEQKLSQKEEECIVERARRLLIRSFMSIELAGTQQNNSGFRMGNVNLENEDKFGNPTFRNCGKDWAGWKNELDKIAERLSSVMIYNKDAFDFINSMSHPECLLYVDPPYHEDTRSATRYEIDLNHEDHLKLVEHLLATKSKVVLSGYQCHPYEALEKEGWTRVDRLSRANMSEEKRVESLWLSPNCEPEPMLF